MIRFSRIFFRLGFTLLLASCLSAQESPPIFPTRDIRPGLKGVGWTQLDNTVAVDYDNSYVGYGCGFNSNGDVVLNLHATGAPGTHLIDVYPVLYTLSPSFANTPFGMLPVLTYQDDEPGLALGYKLPAIRLAITVEG